MDKKLPSKKNIWNEKTFYYGLFGVMLFVYLMASFVIPASDAYFGFSQFRYLGAGGTFFFVAITLLFLLTYRYYRISFDKYLSELNEWFFASQTPAILVAIFMVGIFFYFHTNFINQDGRAFEAKFLQAMPFKDAYIKLDEALEFYVHSRFWVYTNQRFGWDVELSYRTLSSLAGGIFIFVLLKYCRQLLPGKALLLALLCISGGYMQLFFGDVENYTLTATIIICYLLTSFLFIKKSISIVYPSIVLAIAVSFHLLSVLFLPSLVYLYYVGLKQKQYKPVLAGIAAFLFIILFTLTFCIFNGLSINDIRHSHAVGAFLWSGYWVFLQPTPGSYYFGLLNLLFLLAPFCVLIFPLVVFRKINFSEHNIFLLIASLFFLLFFITWRAQLGIYNDWNLFAIMGIPLAIFVWGNILAEEMADSRYILLALGMLFFMQTYLWVLYNHAL
jgi:hypothetical protein